MSSLRDRVKGVKSNVAGGADAFIEAAVQQPQPEPGQPWEDYNKKAVPRTTFNLRLNDYELCLLRHLAERRDESMQKIAKRVLIPALERLAEESSKQD